MAVLDLAARTAGAQGIARQAKIGTMVGAATDPAALAAVKRRLTRNCRLLDTDFFRRQIEAAYEKMWQTWLMGKPPEGFDQASAQ